MANIITAPESGIYFDGNTAGYGDIPTLTGDASGVAIQYDGYAGIKINSSATGDNYQDRFSVEGANGRLFGVSDAVTGTVFSVNDAAGLPIIEVESTADYDKITIGEYGTDALVISGSSVKIGGNVALTGITSAQITEALGYTPVSSESDSQNLHSVLSFGRVSALGIDVGPITGDSLTLQSLSTYDSSEKTVLLINSNNEVGSGLLGTAAYSANTDFAASTHNHDASDINAGTLDAARIPDLSATYLGVTAKAADSDKLDNLDSASFLRSDAADTASEQITFNGRAIFNGSTSETSNKGTLFNEGNYVQFSHQPLSRNYGNEMLWADLKHSVSTSGTIGNASAVFRPGDTYAYFSAATEGANPVQWTIEGSIVSTTNVNSRRVVIFAHIGFSCDLVIEIKNSSSTWETIFDDSYTFISTNWHFFALTPEITYPTDWSIQGIRVTIDNYGASTNRYVGQIGITNTRDHDTFPYIGQGGGKIYDGGVLNFGSSSDLQIHHESSGASYIKHTNANAGLAIASDILTIKNASTSETMATFTQNGAVELYYDNSKKFETTSSGITVIGSIVKSGGSSSEFLKADGSVDSNTYLTSVSQADVTQHQAALSITESQISDLQSYLTTSSAETMYLAIGAKAADSDKLDNIDSASFLRSDVDDTFGSASKTLTIEGVVRSNNNGNVYESNFQVSTTNKSTALYAYEVDRSGSTVGGIRIDGSVVIPDGTAGSPALTFLNDTNTGLYRSSNDRIGFSAGGSQRAYIDANGITAQGNVYATADFRNFSNTWKATTGTTSNGFEFTNTADSRTPLTIGSSGNVSISTVNNRSISIKNVYGSTNNGLAFAVGSGTPWIDFAGGTLTIKAEAYADLGSWNNATNTVLTINSSGNVVATGNIALGGGALQSYHSNVTSALALDDQASVFTRADQLFLGNNFYYGASDAGIAIETGKSSLIQLDRDKLRFFFAASVNAGYTASLQERLRLTDAGDLSISGSVTTEGPDGGMVMRAWQADSAYGMIGTANMANSEYALLTNGTNTYISGGASGFVSIRGGNNDTSPQLKVTASNIEFIDVPSKTTETTALVWDGLNVGYRELGTNAFNSTAFITASSTDTLTNKTWNGNTIASSYLDADTAHLSGTQTFTGAKIFEQSGTNALALKISDGTSFLQFVPNLGSGGYTQMASAGDIGLIFSTDDSNSSAEAGKGLVIAPWSDGGGLKIDDSGNVGIGTTTPSADLHVNSSNNIGLQLQHASRPTIAFTDGTNYGYVGLDNGGSIITGTSDNDLAIRSPRDIVFGYNSAAKATIASSGNVGIGITDPQAKLHVESKILISQDTGDRPKLAFSENVTDDDEFVLEYNGAGAGEGNYVAFYSDISGWAGIGQGLNYIPANGRVGIGTNTPAQKLTVEAGHILLSSNSYDLRGTDTGGNQRTLVRINSSNEAEYGSSLNGPIKFMGGGSYTERMRIHTNGNIGIGVTDPDVELEVGGDIKLNKDAGIHVFTDTVSSSSSEDIFSVSNTHGAQAFRATFVCSTAGYSAAKTYEVVHQYNENPVYFKVVDTGPYGSHDFDVSFTDSSSSGVKATITNNSSSINADITTTLFLGGSPTSITVTAL